MHQNPAVGEDLVARPIAGQRPISRLQGEAMTRYRLLFLDHAGRLVDYRVMNCSDDKDAVATAEQLQGSYSAVEIWSDTARVVTLSKSELRPAA
jgi:hypothetical protein